MPVWTVGSFMTRLVCEPQERLTTKRVIRIFVSAVSLTFLFSTCITGIVTAATLMGYVEKRGEGFVIEADDGDYIVKGKDLSKLVDNWLK